MIPSGGGVEPIGTDTINFIPGIWTLEIYPRKFEFYCNEPGNWMLAVNTIL
jgi:hypothetical protein